MTYHLNAAKKVDRILNNSKNARSFYVYFIVIIGLPLFTVWISTMNIHDDSYTKGMMLSDLDNHKVAMVTIKPNEATPTGADS